MAKLMKLKDLANIVSIEYLRHGFYLINEEYKDNHPYTGIVT